MLIKLSFWNLVDRFSIWNIRQGVVVQFWSERNSSQRLMCCW